MGNGTTDRAEPERGHVLVEILADSTVSYASYQNNIPLLHSLSITNVADKPLHDLEISVRCEPEFSDAMRMQFERLDPKETRRIDALDLKLRHRYLAELNEAKRSRLIVLVSSAGVELVRTDYS